MIGIYHSHPDSPAKPSEYDRVHAWPVYVYVIVSVKAGKADDVKAWTLREEAQAEVRGRDMLSGLPKTVVLGSVDVRRALDEPVTQIIDAIRGTLDKTPPELAADIMDRGIVLAGGGEIGRAHV